MKLSKKKKDVLYGQVHADIMNARIEIVKLINEPGARAKVDDVLSALTFNAPLNAIKVFNPDEQ
jgi:hypothetical protein